MRTNIPLDSMGRIVTDESGASANATLIGGATTGVGRTSTGAILTGTLPASMNNLLLETGDNFLLETGDKLILES